MRVLVVNAGSSSLKHALVDCAGEVVLARGEERWEPAVEPGRHARALSAALAAAGAGTAEAVGHRVVHGGARFDGPAIVVEFDSTTVVLPGYGARIDDNFNILIDRKA